MAAAGKGLGDGCCNEWKEDRHVSFNVMMHTSVTMYWNPATSKQITTRETRERWISNWFQTGYTLVGSLLSRFLGRLALVGHFRMYSDRRGPSRPHQDEWEIN